MDQERLNEFRRRLRRGNKIRVVNGQVMLNDDPNGGSPQGGKINPSVGVQVKPHEWGA